MQEGGGGCLDDVLFRHRIQRHASFTGGGLDARRASTAVPAPVAILCWSLFRSDFTW